MLLVVINLSLITLLYNYFTELSFSFTVSVKKNNYLVGGTNLSHENYNSLLPADSLGLIKLVPQNKKKKKRSKLNLKIVSSIHLEKKGKSKWELGGVKEKKFFFIS